jgi:integrase
LQKCIKILIGKGIETNNKELQTNAEELSKLFDINWSEEISSNALKTLDEAKRNSTKSVLPLAEDVKLLGNYLKAEACRVSKILLEAKCADEIVQAWSSLSEITLCQTILFNRRRAGEVSKMTLKDYENKQLSNKEGNLDSCLSPFEKELCKLFYRSEIVGKRGRTVPVLFSKQAKENLDKLIEKRELIGNPENKYLFPTRTSNSHIRGTDVMRKFATECGAEAPERLRSTKLRKHIATMSQILNLNENELDILAQFMGHDIRVHREYYRLPEATLQVAKVSKLLLMMEEGGPKLKTGQSIDDVTIEENESCSGIIKY